MAVSIRRAQQWGALGLIFAAFVFLSSCSHTSVRHLNRAPWGTGKTQTLEMKFWRFDYKAMPVEDSFGIRGTAFPNSANVPDWPKHIDELWLAVYLSDLTGKVIAKDVHVLLPRPLNRGAGVDFEFLLKPEDLGGTHKLFVTFGYRMVLSDRSPGEGEAAAPKVFFAHEGALERF